MYFPSLVKVLGWRPLRRVFKFLSLLKSSLLATFTGVARRFELLGIVTLVGAVGKVASGFEDIGAGAVAVAELGILVARVGVLTIGVELFTTGVGALSFLPNLGFPLVFLWDIILKSHKNVSQFLLTGLTSKDIYMYIYWYLAQGWKSKKIKKNSFFGPSLAIGFSKI